MTVVETVLVFALIPLAIFGVIALMTLAPRAARKPRYRAGQEWNFEPVWWSANPGGLEPLQNVALAGAGAALNDAGQEGAAGSPATARGGARGNW